MARKLPAQSPGHSMNSIRLKMLDALEDTGIMARARRYHHFAICTDSRGCDDLEKGKAYRLLPDEKAAKEGLVRVIDESGEDYLYPESCLVAVELPESVEDALLTEF